MKKIKPEWTFTVERGIWQMKEKRGQTCYFSNAQRNCGDYYGHGCAFDTIEEAFADLRDFQQRHKIPDEKIEWRGLPPPGQKHLENLEQMELF